MRLACLLLLTATPALAAPQAIPGFASPESVLVAGDRASPDPVLAVAAELVTTPLARDRPLWRAVAVTGTPDGGVGCSTTTTSKDCTMVAAAEVPRTATPAP